MHTYNTLESQVVLKEYGRNVQKLVDHLKTIEDKEERSKKAATLVDLMRQINPSSKDTSEVTQKLWDDLHIISGFDLDIESPYLTPEKEILYKKPDKVPYANNSITFKHFGLNIELLIAKAITLEDPEEQEAAIIHIGKLMKTFFYSYNKDIMEDEVVYTNIKRLSKNKLSIDMDKVKEGDLFEPQKRESRSGGRQNDSSNNRRNNSNKNNSNNNRRNNSNNNNRRKRS